MCEYYAHYDCKEFAVNDCKQGAAYIPPNESVGILLSEEHACLSAMSLFLMYACFACSFSILKSLVSITKTVVFSSRLK